MAEVVPVEVDDVSRSADDRAVRKPRSDLTEATGEESDRHRPAGYGVTDEDERDGRQCRAGESDDRLQSSDEQDEGERPEEADADQCSRGAGKGPEDRVDGEHAAAGSEQCEQRAGGDAPPQPQAHAEQKQAEAAEHARDEESQAEHEA